jgi:hypothetical protein
MATAREGMLEKGEEHGNNDGDLDSFAEDDEED